MAEQEGIISEISERLTSQVNEISAFKLQLNDMKNLSDEANLKVQKAIDMADEASKKITAILGDSNSM